MMFVNSVTYELHPLHELTGCFIGRFNIVSMGPSARIGVNIWTPFHIVRFVESPIVFPQTYQTKQRIFANVYLVRAGTILLVIICFGTL